MGVSTGDSESGLRMPRGGRAHRGMLARCQAAGRGLLSWAFSDACMLCDAPVDADASGRGGDAESGPAAGSPVCSACLRDLPALPPACPTCAMPSPAGAVCGACIARPPSFDRTIAVWRYTFPLDRLVLALKFHAKFSLAPFLARRLADGFRGARVSDAPDLLIPMPLHRTRLAERGFNQSAQIGRPLARLLGRELQTGGVTRVRPTASQTELDPRDRRRNVRGAFACDIDLSGRRVAVVDDVMTTGASLDELARVLKRAGAAEVLNLVVARAYPD